jgi:biofilm protein TabA
VKIYNLENCDTIEYNSELLKEAIDYLLNTDLSNIENGCYNIKNNDILAIYDSYETKKIIDCKIEAHRKYIDIQFVISGEEQIGYIEKKHCSIFEPFNINNDVGFYTTVKQLEFLTLKSGEFVIIPPSIAHMPGIRVDEETPIFNKKLVMKISI